MKNGDFELSIIGADAKSVPESEGGYVGLAHDEAFAVKLTNNSSSDVAAVLFIDGDKKGAWFIRAHDSTELKRPEEVNAQFIFAKKGTTEFGDALLGVLPADDLGVVSVTFMPGQQQRPSLAELLNRGSRNYGLDESFGGSGLKSFGGLGFADSFGATRGSSFGFGSRNLLPDIAPEPKLAPPAEKTTPSSGSPKLSAGGTRFGEETDQTFRTVSFSFDRNTDRYTKISVRLVHNPERVLQFGPSATPVPAALPDDRNSEEAPFRRDPERRGELRPKPVGSGE